MDYPAPLTHAVFERREKRFFIHGRLPDGESVVAHTNNTGTMRGCLFPGGDIYLSPAANPARKLRWTLEMTRTVPQGTLVGVNTLAANKLVREALASGLLDLMPAGAGLRAEVRYGRQGSRADYLATGPGGARTWIEVKNVSLVEDGHARFPDAPTERGRKHLNELAAMVAAGDRAALVFCIQRDDATTAGPADDIDPEYGRLLRQVAARGVQIVGLACRPTLQGIRPLKILPVVL